jgi:putative glutamine amidotransferase
MPIRIAIPEPTGTDPAYNRRSLPEYLAALQASGAEAIVVPAHERQDRVARLLAGVHGILLPGSPHDVNPQRFGEDRIAECAADDPARTAVDELLLQDAFNLHKPILGICFGIQNLNVWRNGSLIQDLKTSIDHDPGGAVVEAHPVRIERGSILAGLLPPGEQETIQVNSSHHQAIRSPGDNLLASAISPEDGVIEAVELDSSEHFVVAVQWHPERSYSQSAFSRAIFAAFVGAAGTWTPRRIETSSIAHLES